MNLQIRCRDCYNEFILTDQDMAERYALGYKHPPATCQECRDKRHKDGKSLRESFILVPVVAPKRLCHLSHTKGDQFTAMSVIIGDKG